MRALIYSNIYIAAAAALLTLASAPLLAIDGPLWATPALAFFSTLAVYNFDRFGATSPEDRHQMSERHHWLQSNRLWNLGLFAASVPGIIGSVFFIQPETLLALLPLALISLGYCVPLLVGLSTSKKTGALRRARLKEIPGLKTFFIAIVWAGATVLLPAVEAGIPLFEPEVQRAFWERWLFVFALTLPFDIRDLERDRGAGIHTIAAMLGARRTMVLSIVLMASFCAVTSLRYFTGDASTATALAISGFITLAALLVGHHMLQNKDQRPGELYYVGWLDGALFVQAALLLFI